MYKIKSFFKRIANVITWLPVIWNDKQWDHVFVYEILYKKLSLMEKFFREHGSHVLSDDCADSIQRVCNALSRLINKKYTDVTFLKFYEKFPDYDWNIKKQFVESDKYFETINGKEVPLLEYKNQDTPEQQELMKQCFAEADKMEQDDLDFVFAEMRLHIEGWWD